MAVNSIIHTPNVLFIFKIVLASKEGRLMATTKILAFLSPKVHLTSTKRCFYDSF